MTLVDDDQSLSSEGAKISILRTRVVLSRLNRSDCEGRM